MQKPERSTYTTTDFAEWQTAKNLVITPRFQRRAVWSPQAKSFFIDTLLQGLPVPPIYVRVRQSDDKKKIIREVVDGQQRLKSVLEFIRDEFALSSSLDAPYAGHLFSKLTTAQQDKIRTYSFICEVMTGATDAEVLSIFARLNTYSVKLNDQELRNGRWFGKFKTLVYRISHDHVDFWREHKLFSDSQIARMLEVEFVSELVAAVLEGMQDKKKSLSDFYDDYDDEFPQQSTVDKRVRECLSVGGDILSRGGADSEFHRSPLFYTLFCCIFHRKYGLPEVESPAGKCWVSSDIRRLAEATLRLSIVLAESKNDEDVASKHAQFIQACSRQTDNIKPRQIRFKALYSAAFQ